MFAAIYIIEDYSWYHRISTWGKFDLRYYVIRAIYVIISGLMAIIIPKFGLFLDFLGAFAGTILCLIIPVIIYEKVFKGSLSTSQLILNKCILIGGGIFGGISSVCSFYALLQEIFYKDEINHNSITG
mmetsp:Transcript_10261/g.9065  ORF Transcript_10261/g.9065 Transcript_10261/m.9065 type:complete len:128 (+) Transcript_10261:981-1364(+)